MRHPVPLRARILGVVMDWPRPETPRDILDPLIQENEMLSVLDTRDKKLKKWVTPTLTRIHHASASCGGSTGGVTEGGHVATSPIHLRTSSNFSFSPVSVDAGLLGTAAASS